MNLKAEASSTRSANRWQASPLDFNRSSYTTAMSVSDAVVGTVSGELDFGDTALMDPTPLLRVHFNDNQKTSQCQTIRNITQFTRKWNENFGHCICCETFRIINQIRTNNKNHTQRNRWQLQDYGSPRHSYRTALNVTRKHFRDTNNSGVGFSPSLTTAVKTKSWSLKVNWLVAVL